MPVRPLALALFLLGVVVVQAQGPLLERRVTIQADDVRLSRALELIAKEAGLKLSYNAAVVPVDSVVSLNTNNETVERVLRSLLPGRLRWRASGSHLIISGEAGRKQRFTSEGSVVDATNGQGIARATVLEVLQNNAVNTDDQGAFRIQLTGDEERLPLRIARHGYRDTIIQVQRNATVGRIALRRLDDLERLEPLCNFERCAVEDLGMTRLLVPSARLEQAANLGLEERAAFQLSLVPGLSTNGAIAGSVVNRVSINILGGYARGVEGAEVAGGINLIGQDMNGFQFSGLANLVGGSTNGFQISGGINHSMRSLRGLQLGGLANTVWDTLAGVQVAGGVNVVKRGMSGTQLSGATNVALGNVDGLQVSGGVNVAHGVVNKAQVAGALNYARGVRGGQVAGGVNVALGEVSGGQVGFGANYAQRVSGGQFSFGANVVPGEVSGGQVGFGLNYAHRVTGGQFSFGANVVPGVVEAGQVGFGLNYAHHVTGGQFSFGANIVPGTVDGGQVGAFNFARRITGGQVGFVNFSDTLEGGAVGLLTISLKGYHRFDLITGDVFPLSLQLRTGTRVFHNILGYSPSVTVDQRWGFLYGFGFELHFGERFFANIDITGEQVVEQEEWVDAWNVLGRSSVTPGVRFSNRVFLYAGPVLNLLATDWRDPETGAYLSALPPAEPNFQERSGTTAFHGWWGWKAGLGVRF
ncbi:MAG: STN domain-containing protein [Flavobacteriales bacterium]|nr:STN domain-containing protein [Flavobacteriales bacterium]